MKSLEGQWRLYMVGQYIYRAWVNDYNFKCLTCSNVADNCTPEDGPCNDKPERLIFVPENNKEVNET